MGAKVLPVEIEGLDVWGDARESTNADAPTGISPPRVREGETRRDTWERIRRAARAGGMSRRDAYDYATREADRLYANGMAEAPEPFNQADPAPVAPDPPAAADQAPAASAPSSSSTGGVQGLGEIPADWPALPPNASLAAEVAWVHANRIRVRQGEGVDLSRAISPAPSYAALSWLETSILYPSKFADVCVKASGDQADDQEDVRREKIAMSDMRTLLSEAMAVI